MLRWEFSISRSIGDAKEIFYSSVHGEESSWKGLYAGWMDDSTIALYPVSRPYIRGSMNPSFYGAIKRNGEKISVHGKFTHVYLYVFLLLFFAGVFLGCRGVVSFFVNDLKGGLFFLLAGFGLSAVGASLFLVFRLYLQCKSKPMKDFLLKILNGVDLGVNHRFF